jgi:hypothetical protein
VAASLDEDAETVEHPRETELPGVVGGVGAAVGPEAARTDERAQASSGRSGALADDRRPR